MTSFSFLPFTNLESKTLLLRQITSNDINEVFELRRNPETMKYIPRPLITTIDEAMGHVKMIQDKIETNEGINWAITLKGNPKMIGIIGHYRIKWEHFRSEIGYMLLPEYHGKGIVTQAIQLIVSYGFDEMKMHSLEAIIDPKNTASAKVLEKNNFVKEAHLLQNEFYDGKFLDTVIYSLLKKE
ncbi:putative ribosomal-protein-amino-adic N-acetyltransferase [Flavobacterium psychrophilum]|uniref:GNAT family N-acetyltransferase n=1 Tax=Flavobacterium psychrophilum TaxID=96345 RepID=UPI000B7C5586|nr:GNAT family N-acetyltransferase [Flavobacterium psychrophilum]SNB02319.1 putative ribosomal-protein-amino-adic N-acetyltransferase [Flavobacterium psychrophilum]SNB43544.1 putative ribosomal-protein-amino-adic N-acetyltransferase [Flavobacterium psychrophilum]